MAERAGRSRGRPRGDALRPQQVCARLDIQPYQLKFWETEFEQLGRSVGPRRVYEAEALALATEIRRLLVDRRMNLDEAREALAEKFPAPAAAQSQEPEGEEQSRPAAGEGARDGGAARLRARVRSLERALAEARAALDEQARRHEMELERQRALADELRRELASREKELGAQREALSRARRDVRALRTRLGEAEQEAGRVSAAAAAELSELGIAVRSLGSDLAELLMAMSDRHPASPQGAGEGDETSAPPPARSKGNQAGAGRGG